jgi:hypothetical protein
VGRDRINVPVTVLLVLGTLAVLVPLFVTVNMSLKTTAQAVDGNAFSLPSPFTLTSFVEAWNLTNLPRGFAVSLFITAIAVVGEIVISALAAYAIVRNWDRRLFRWSFFYLLAAMFIPFPVVALPQIQLTGMLGLDNPLGVADPAAAGTHVRDRRHLRVHRVVERLHDALADHLGPVAADRPGPAEHVPDPVQQQLQRRLRLLPDGDGAGDPRLPGRAALGDVRPHPGRDQVTA